MPEGDAPASGDTPALPPEHPLAGMIEQPATTTDDAIVATTAPPPPTSDTDWKAEAEKWKTMAQKHESKWKAAAPAVKELETLRQQSMSETEKAVAAAKAEGRAQALAEVGGQLVTAQIRGMAQGRLAPKALDAMIERLDVRAFLGDDGTVDHDAIASFVESIAPPAPTPDESGDNQRWPDLGQGQQGTPPLNASGLERALTQAVNRG